MSSSFEGFELLLEWYFRNFFTVVVVREEQEERKSTTDINVLGDRGRAGHDIEPTSVQYCPEIVSDGIIVSSSSQLPLHEDLEQRDCEKTLVKFRNKSCRIL
mmetsp:Transcript_28125/g.30299  ORF Transcript_28125/g.30299 Transcript_28125/m.30299 type:complete len:102 (-) Transcript_28125:705-1010(-)